MRNRLLSGAVGITAAAVVASATVGNLAGLGIVLLGTVVLWVARRRMDDASRAELAADLNERQRQRLPAEYAAREIYPVPNWAWVAVALVVMTPYVLGQVHVLSQGHAGTWIVLGFVAGGLVLYGSGRYERTKARHRPT